MKKLNENIEDIKIRGGIEQLSEVVRAMDISLQNIAYNTDQLVVFLARHSATNKGVQYERVVNTSMFLRDEMCAASLDLNEMQKQVVAYQNKIYRYEGLPESAPYPNPYLVTKRQISVETSTVQFNRSAMLEVAAVLRNFSEQIVHHIRTLNEKKDLIKAVWQDSQYEDFAEFIVEVTKNVYTAVRVFEDYVIYLEERIKELS